MGHALELQEQLSVGLPGETLVGQRGPLDVATQPFEGLAVVGRDADRGVQVEVPGRGAAVREAANRVLAHPSGDGAGPQPERLASGDGGGEEHSLAVIVVGDLALVVEQPSGSQERFHAFTHLVHHELHLGGGRRGSGVEHGGVRLVDPVEHERVEVQVRVQRRAERLLERHRAASSCGEARGVAVVREHLGQEGRQHLAAQLAVPREAEPQRHGKRAST
jgi:hypothetical protein